MKTNFHKFLNASGELECFVNLDDVSTATPLKDGRIRLHVGDETVDVDLKQFETAISSKDSYEERISQSFKGLIQALDRLGMRIPASIRLHM